MLSNHSDSAATEEDDRLSEIVDGRYFERSVNQEREKLMALVAGAEQDLTDDLPEEG